MPLFEHMPYTNFENINLDWILKTIKQHDTDISTLKTDVQNINGQITTINTTITEIQEQIGEFDITELEARVDAVELRCTQLNNNINNVLNRVIADEGDIATNTGHIATNTEDISTNNDASIARDNALAARIASLERAHLHDIYNYYSEGNMLLFGSDLRNLPDSCKRDGFPIGYGNPTNRHLYVGQTKTRAWKLTANGFQPDTSSTDGYDYYQMGQFPASLGVADYVTVTFAVSTGGDATPSAWYKHTFQASNEQWEVASGCIVKFAQHTDGVNPEIYTVQFLGTPANWANVVDSSHYIPYIFVEWGTGSVSTEATDKCKFDIKDRLPFMDITAPEYTPTVVGGNKFFTNLPATATWVDAQGFTHTVEVPIDLRVYYTSVDGKTYNVEAHFVFKWTNNVDMILNLNAFSIDFNQQMSWGENDSDDPFFSLSTYNAHLVNRADSVSRLQGAYEYDLRNNLYVNYAFSTSGIASRAHYFQLHVVSSGLDGNVSTLTTEFISNFSFIKSN